MTPNLFKTGKGLGKIQIHSQLDCPEYRNIISVIGNLDQGKRQRVVALDLPRSMYDQTISRNEYMAQSISKIFQKVPDAKILVILGNQHVLKILDWQDHVLYPYKSLRSYLKKLQPDLRMFSICQLVGNDPHECDFTREYSLINGSVALDCDDRFAGWETGLMQVMAIKPTAICDLLDGVIVY